MSNNVGMSIDEFLDHSTGGGGRSNFLGNWRKKDPPKITVVLHPAVGFSARWAHNWPRIMTRQDKETGATRLEVWGGQWVCHERELILRKQRFRDENDVREHPPEVCPLCKTIEIIRGAVASGELNWLEPVFKFQGDDSDHDYIITAGGIYNAFTSKDLTPQQKGEMRRAGVMASQAWRENAMARCQYTFAVIDVAHPENGVQITDEAEALGNAMKRAIRDKIDEYGGGETGRLKGNPLRNPYPFLWEYREAEVFEKKYRVVGMSLMEIPEAVAELFQEEPPDISAHNRPGNVRALRSDMEKAALVDLPWDEIFADAERAIGAGAEPDTRPAVADRPAEVNTRPEPAAKAAKPAKAGDDFPASWSNPATPAAATEELFVCDHCEFDGLRATDTTCPKCKSVYDVDGNLTKRPCAACGALTPADGGAEHRSICPDCGAIHDTEAWRVVAPIAPPPPAKRTRSGAKPAE